MHYLRQSRDIWGQRVSSIRNRKCKGPEAEAERPSDCSGAKGRDEEEVRLEKQQGQVMWDLLGLYKDLGSYSDETGVLVGFEQSAMN